MHLKGAPTMVDFVHVTDGRLLMKRLMKMWARRQGSTRMLVFRVDRPRPIDRVIDYFGGGLVPVLISKRAQRKS